MEEYPIMMYGVGDDAAVGVGWEEGCRIVDIIGTTVVVGMDQLGWQCRIWPYGI